MSKKAACEVKSVKQNDCCCVCDTDSNTTDDALAGICRKVRKLPAGNRVHVEDEIKAVLTNNFNVQTCFMPGLFDVKSPDINNMVEKVMDGL